jgi:hypothetical protein
MQRNKELERLAEIFVGATWRKDFDLIFERAH